MIRKISYLILLLILPFVGFSQNNNLKGKTLKITGKSRLIGDVAIGSTSFDGSAILTITSSTQGMLAPRMNTAARDAIGSPADGLLIYNNQTNQYEFFESTWKAIGGGDGNGIYDGDGSLSNNPTTITMGGNSLDIFGNQTGFRGINAAFGTRVALFEDNVGTNLVEINNNGSVGIGTDGFSSSRLTAKSSGNTNSTFSYIGQNLAGDFTFAVSGSGNIGFGTLSFLSGHKMAIAEMDRMIFVNTNAESSTSDLRWQYDGTLKAAIQYNNGTSPKRFDFFVGGVDASNIVFTIDSTNHAIVNGKLSTIAASTTLGVAVTTFAITSNVMTMTGDGGGNTVATITGANSGTILTMIFVDDKISLTDDNGHGANTIDLSAAFSSLDDTTLTLIYDGTSWYETSRSLN